MYQMKTKPLSKLYSALFLLIASMSGISYGSSHEEVWSEVLSTPYQRLPEYKTNYESLSRGGINYIANAANRTLSTKADLLPRFQKLVHPVGICFSGTWNISKNNAYTGQFAMGTRAPIILRASEAMGYSNQGDFRSFGLAGKIFRGNETANFFTMDDLGGTEAQSFLDLPKTNAPDISVHFSALRLLPIISRIAAAFSQADSNPAFRPLYQVSELGLSNVQEAKTPQWMLLRSENNRRLGPLAKDFRNELRLKNFAGGKLEFAIYTSDKGDKAWQKIGFIELTEEALSDGCDHRLHFTHPRLK